MTTTRDRTTRVVIVGAGYAGMTAAHRLHGKADVTVVSPTDRFVDRIRLHQFAAGSWSEAAVAPALAEVLPPGAVHVLGTVTAVGPGRVRLEDGRVLTADHIIVAAGSGVGGGVTNLESSRRLRRELAELGAGSLVRIDGAGHTGVETAAEIAEQRPDLRIVLVDPAGVLPHVGGRARRRVLLHLQRAGVTVSTDAGAPEPDLLVDCTGFATPTIDGLKAPDATLTFGPGLWAAGDIAATGHRWSCAAAEPMGAHVADNIIRSASGESPVPFRFGFAIQCISLGRRRGLVQVVRADDFPRRVTLGGLLGALVKEGISRMARRVATSDAAARYRWPSGPTVDELRRRQDQVSVTSRVR